MNKYRIIIYDLLSDSIAYFNRLKTYNQGHTYSVKISTTEWRTYTSKDQAEKDIKGIQEWYNTECIIEVEEIL